VVDSPDSLLCEETVKLRTAKNRTNQLVTGRKQGAKIVIYVEDLLKLAYLFKSLQHFLSLTKMSE